MTDFNITTSNKEALGKAASELSDNFLILDVIAGYGLR